MHGFLFVNVRLKLSSYRFYRVDVMKNRSGRDHWRTRHRVQYTTNQCSGSEIRIKDADPLDKNQEFWIRIQYRLRILALIVHEDKKMVNFCLSQVRYGLKNKMLEQFDSVACECMKNLINIYSFSKGNFHIWVNQGRTWIHNYQFRSQILETK